MKLVEINWKPNDRQLRQFGIICLVALPLIGGIWGARPPVVGVLAGIGLMLAVAGVAMPKTLKPVFLALTIVTAPIGMVIGEVAMLLIYFGVFLPMGLVFRLLKRDVLQIKRDQHASTYWETKRQPKGVASYYRQS